MDQEPDVIRHNIDETRSALTEKLETLEEQVRDTVHDAKASVEDTIESVKSTVHQTVESVKETFDIPHQVQKHPWAMVGGTFVAGFVLGNLTRGRIATGSSAPVWSANRTSAPSSQAASSSTTNHASSVAGNSTNHGILNNLLGHFDEEIKMAKGMAIGALAGVVRDLAKQAVPVLAPQIDEMINSATSKLGGKPVEGSVLETAGAAQDHGGSRPNNIRRDNW